MAEVQIDKTFAEKIRKVFDEKIAKYIVQNLFQKNAILEYDETIVILQIFENGLQEIEKALK